jgi:predicted kinase
MCWDVIVVSDDKSSHCPDVYTIHMSTDPITIYIYRGLPGAGKNTHAESIDVDHILDADSYHVEDGDYCYEETQVGEAHASCFRQYLQLLPQAHTIDSIAVSNTHVERADYTPYVQAAEAFKLGDRVRLIHCKCSIETSVERNVHEVPREDIEDMATRWEEPTDRDPPQHTIVTD